MFRRRHGLDRFRARLSWLQLTITLAAEEAANLRNETYDLVQCGWRGRYFLFSQQMSATYFIGIGEQTCVEIWTGSALAHQVGDTPSHHHEQGQRAFEPVDRRQLQRFYLATVLENMEINFDFPACPVAILS